MAADLIRLMRGFFTPASESVREIVWQPATDIYRTRTGWLIKFDLAGVRPDDIQLEVKGSRLTVRGTRRDWCQEEGACCYRMEISYSRFERSISLPGNLEEATIAAEHREGMLLVRIQLEANRR